MKELEREFQGWILDVAARHGWRAWHVPTPMRPVKGRKFIPDSRGRGLPDLLMLHDDPPRLILAEVKVDEPLSDDQKEFLRLARAVARETSPEPLLERWRELYNHDGILPDYNATEMHRAIFEKRATVGVYTWRPANRDLIEATLRSRVMVAS